MGVVRFLPFVVELAVLVYCLIDCIQTDEGDIRNLSKGLWVILIILLPIIGGVAWLVAGRPLTGGPRRQVPWPSTRTAGFPEYERPRRPIAPDDDPDFLLSLRADRERERRLEEWESRLRAREAELAASADAVPAEESGAPGADGEPERA